MRIYLRPLYVTDIERIYNIKSNPFTYNKEFTCHDTTKVSIHQVQTWFNNFINETNTIRLGICVHDTHALIGLITLGNVDYVNSACEIHIAIDYEYQGKGYGEESMTLLLEYTSRIVRIKNISLNVHKDNIVAVSLYEKIGFEKCDSNGYFLKYIYNVKP